MTPKQIEERYLQRREQIHAAGFLTLIFSYVCIAFAGLISAATNNTFGIVICVLSIPFSLFLVLISERIGDQVLIGEANLYLKIFGKRGKDQ